MFLLILALALAFPASFLILGLAGFALNRTDKEPKELKKKEEANESAEIKATKATEHTENKNARLGILVTLIVALTSHFYQALSTEKAEVSPVLSAERQGQIEDAIQANATVSVTYPEEEEREIPSTTTATIPLVTYQEKEEGEISSTGSVVADDYAKQWGRNVLRKSDLTASGNDKVRFVWWGTLKRMQIKGSKDDKGIPYYESFATSLDDLNEKRPMGYIVPSTYVYALARKYEIGSSQEKWYLVHVSGYGFYRWIQADKNNLTSPEPTNFPVSFLN